MPTWISVSWSRLFSCGLFPSKMAHRQASCFPVAFHGKFCTPPQGGWVGTVSSQMDWERLPVAPLYADVRAYCSHVKTYCKRARLLSSHPQLFILSLFDLAHHIFGETFRTFEVSILSVNRGKLDIRYLVGPYGALHSTSTNPCALDNHAFQKMLFSQTVFNNDSAEEIPSIFRIVYRLLRQWLPQRLCPCFLGQLSSALFV